MILRCKFTKIGDISYISHLDILKIFIRALRRSRIDVFYSEGFHPHPKISFSSALSLGIQSYTEFIDIDIKNDEDEKHFLKDMNESLPDGIDIVEYKIVEKPIALTKIMNYSLYEFYLEENLQAIVPIIEDVIKREELIIQKKNKKKQIKDINVREKIYSIEINSEKNVIKAVLLNSSEGALKPSEMIKALNENYQLKLMPYKIVKLAAMMLDEDKFTVI
ncbi:MAG: TIGR03936 family radical SAM-associated protein [Proteocatella sp.]